jgi:hypothetical protein
MEQVQLKSPNITLYIITHRVLRSPVFFCRKREKRESRRGEKAEGRRGGSKKNARHKNIIYSTLTQAEGRKMKKYFVRIKKVSTFATAFERK